MRQINLIIMMMVFLALGWSCQELDNLDPEGNWELTNPEVVSPVENSLIVLDESKLDDLITFTWNAAKSSAGYGVYYSVVIDSAGSNDFQSPVMTIGTGTGTKELSLSVRQRDLDEMLSLAGFAANETAELTWGVRADCIGKIAYGKSDISVKRFATEIKADRLFISGTATENGNDLSKAIAMKRLNGPDGNPTSRFELYTSLEKDKIYKFFSRRELPAHQYGGKDGVLGKSGNAITATESGVYRISVDIENNTYSLLKIERWNVKGSPIIGGWDGDEPLDYQGGSIWKASIELVNTGGFLFRGEVEGGGYWDYLLKRVVGTANTVVMESQAASQGLSYEDIPSDKIGTFIFTLDLSADAYTYTIVKDPAVPDQLDTPEKLFLLADGVNLHEFVKDGDIFNSGIYLSLESGVNYTLNSSEDGSGTAYSLDGNIGTSDQPDNSSVSGVTGVVAYSAGIEVTRDMACKISVNFSTAKLNWMYYNIFLFHWDEIDQKWDERNEFLMTYVHPYTYQVSANLKKDFDMKFISPWDNDFGAEDPAQLSGNLINRGGANIRNITSDGSYAVTITLSNDFSEGTYEFVK